MDSFMFCVALVLVALLFFLAGKYKEGIPALTLAIVGLLPASFLLINRHEEGSKRFPGTNSLDMGTKWEVIDLEERKDKGKEGFNGILKSLGDKKIKGIEFRQNEKPPPKFEAGKLRGVYGFRTRELKPIEEENK